MRSEDELRELYQEATADIEPAEITDEGRMGALWMLEYVLEADEGYGDLPPTLDGDDALLALLKGEPWIKEEDAEEIEEYYADEFGTHVTSDDERVHVESVGEDARESGRGQEGSE